MEDKMKLRYLQLLLPIVLSLASGGCDCCRKDPGFVEFDFSVRKETCYGDPVKFSSIRGDKDTAYVTFIVENTGTCGLALLKDGERILSAPGELSSSTVPFGGTGISRLYWDCYNASMESTFYDGTCSGRIQLFRKNRHECVTRWGEQDSLLLTRYTTGGYRDSCDMQTLILKHENRTSKPQRIHVRANSVGTCTFHVWLKENYVSMTFPPYFKAAHTIDSLVVSASPPPGQMSTGILTVPPMSDVLFYVGCLEQTPPGGDFCGGTVELYLKD